MKGIVIYSSCYGSTEQYAKWIGEETGFEVKSYKEVTNEAIKDADVVVYGDWVIAGKLASSKWINCKEGILADKKLIVYSVSGAKSDNPELENIFKDSLKSSLVEKASVHRFPGRQDISKMNGKHRFMMKLAIKFIAKTEEEKAAMATPSDFVDKAYIKPLVAVI